MSVDRTDPPAAPTSLRSLDFITAAVALWLFISPWVLHYASGDSWNTWVVSAVIFLVAAADIQRPSARMELVNAVLAAWMFVSPWVFANQGNGAAWNQWLSGALVFILSCAGFLNRRGPTGLNMTHAHG